MPAGKPRQINSQLLEARAHSKTLPRRQTILSSIFFAAQRLGGRVAGNEDGAHISFGRQTLECRLVERLRKVRLPLGRFDLTYHTQQFHRGYRVGFEVTGVLAFEIDTYLRAQVQQVWQETPEASLEKMVPDIADALRRGAAVRQAWDDQDSDRVAFAAREKALRRKAEREAEIDHARWDLLVQLATKTNDARSVRDYIHALIGEGVHDPDAMIGDRTLSQWLEWVDLVLEQRGGQQGLVALFRKLHSIESDFGPSGSSSG